MAATGEPITFIVPGQEDTAGPATRGAAAAPRVSAEVHGGYVKQSVRVGAQRAGGAAVRVQAVPGEDVVVLHIAGGPALTLHPLNARDLMLAQQGTPTPSRSRGGGEAELPNTVTVAPQLRWRGLEQAMPARGA